MMFTVDILTSVTEDRDTLVAVLDAADLVGVAEISSEFDVPRSMISTWGSRKRPGFPEPVLRLRMGPIYRRADVREFLEARP